MGLYTYPVVSWSLSSRVDIGNLVDINDIGSGTESDQSNGNCLCIYFYKVCIYLDLLIEENYIMDYHVYLL